MYHSSTVVGQETNPSCRLAQSFLLLRVKTNYQLLKSVFSMARSGNGVLVLFFLDSNDVLNDLWEELWDFFNHVSQGEMFRNVLNGITMRIVSSPSIRVVTYSNQSSRVLLSTSALLKLLIIYGR